MNTYSFAPSFITSPPDIVFSPLTVDTSNPVGIGAIYSPSFSTAFIFPVSTAVFISEFATVSKSLYFITSTVSGKFAIVSVYVEGTSSPDGGVGVSPPFPVYSIVPSVDTVNLFPFGLVTVYGAVSPSARLQPVPNASFSFVLSTFPVSTLYAVAIADVSSSFSLPISVPFAASFDFSNSPPLIATVTVTPTNINITIIVIINAINVIPFFVFHLYFSFFLFLSGRPGVRPLHVCNKFVFGRMQYAPTCIILYVIFSHVNFFI